jgi:hypothetical protein
MMTIQVSRWPTLISFLGLLLVANGKNQRGPRLRTLLGLEPGFPDPPCTISVPNLMTDRPLLLVGRRDGCNVRRLMYQALIGTGGLGDDAGGLGAAFDPEDLERPADALVDGMRRDAELDRDLLRRQVLGDEAQAIELAVAQFVDRARHPRLHEGRFPDR